MNHLIDAMDMGRIESSLLSRRNDIAQASSFVFNASLLVLVVGGFVYFLYAQYQSNSQKQIEEKRIPFKPTTWYSATRNIRSEDYGGQPFETETGYGVP